MGLRDSLIGFAEDRLGASFVPRERLAAMQESLEFMDSFRDEVADFAYVALNQLSGNRQEMRPERRRRLAERSRIALMQDPLAGAEASLLANFAFGRGVGKPDATDDTVQEIIDEAWTDPVNTEKLTGFEAQRHRSNQLLTDANLFPTAYVSNGRVRLGFLDADFVTSVICDPDDDERPLWYVTHKRRVSWDFENDRVLVADELRDNEGQPRVVYYPHWRNVEDWKKEQVEDGGVVPADQVPPAEKMGDGLVYHLRINRIGRTQFGTPPWARSLRFYSAMNSLTEAHVAMAEAASSIVAKRSVTGGPDAVKRQASQLLSMTGELGSARFGDALRQVDEEMLHGGDRARWGTGRVAPSSPVGPGSFWTENQSDRLEAVNLSSGAGQAAQTAQIVRAPIAGAAQFGQHYFGDASNANLATATSLELPALMNVQAWQETHEQQFRWFVDLVIQEAARAGRLGGDGALSENEDGVEFPLAGRKLSELHVQESTEKAELERRTGKDLSYTFEMPYPGRRNLPDVVTMVQTIAAGFDPNGINVPLRRQLLLFLAKHGMQLDDPSGFVDEVMPEDSVDPGASAFLPKGYDPAPANAPVDPNAPAGGQTGALGGPAAGAKAGRPANPQGDMATAAYEDALSAVREMVDDRFRMNVVGVLEGAAAPSNGNGAH